MGWYSNFEQVKCIVVKVFEAIKCTIQPLQCGLENPSRQLHRSGDTHVPPFEQVVDP